MCNIRSLENNGYEKCVEHKQDLDHRYVHRQTTTLEKLRKLERDCSNPTDVVLRAADNPEFRAQLLPARELNSHAVETLLSLCHQEGVRFLDPTSFTSINNHTQYNQALRAFPLIQSHHQFDKLHRQVKIYFLLRESTLRHPNETFAFGLLADYAAVSRVTIHYWFKGTFRPRLLGLLEKRAATLTVHQHRVAKLRKAENGIRSLDDLTNRLHSRYFRFSDKLQANPNFSQEINDAVNHLNLLNLVEAGIHPSDLATHFNLHKDTIRQTLRQQFQPHLIRLASNIPKHPPNHKLQWVPTLTNGNGVPNRFIQAPCKIYKYEQLLPVFNQLVTLTNPDSNLTRQLNEFGPSSIIIKKWISQFGLVETLEDKIHAFGYIIGTLLSDGHIALESTYSSQFKIELSSKYSWSKTFGNRVVYYLTCLGVPTKFLGAIPAKPPERPHPCYIWHSVKTPFLTWINEGVLNLEQGQIHSDYPVKINWVLDAPRSFQIKILQGLFDGDSWASVINSEIGIASKVNTDFIEQLLLQVEIKPNKCESNQLLIKTKNTLRQAVELPIFLSATNRFECANKIIHMLDRTRLSPTAIDNLPLIRRIHEIRQDMHLSIGQIRIKIYEEFRITLSYGAIKRILDNIDERQKIDYDTVQTFFRVLELKQQFPNISHRQLARRAIEETNSTKSIETLRGWIRGNIPRDAKRAFSEGYFFNKEILRVNPYLYKYLPK